MTFRGRARRRQPDPMIRVRGVTTELAERLAEVNLHLDEFAAALELVASAARTAEESARRAGGDDG